LNPEGVLEKRKELGGVDPKPLISLVEPTGIEPVTSTMPLSETGVFWCFPAMAEGF